MSEHIATVEWHLGDGTFDTSYDRTHVWRFDCGVEVPASAAPHLFGDPSRVDPEEAFVAPISSCHMLWCLYLAAEDGFVVGSYVDHASGVMARDKQGPMRITRVELRPEIAWIGDAPDSEAITDLHERSHRRCFIANSVTS